MFCFLGRKGMPLFLIRRLLCLLCFVGVVIKSSLSFAGAFQLWEQDGATIGNYHAGYAAQALDASTGFYNPAGLTRFKNQQIVLAGNTVLTSFKYVGTVAVVSSFNSESVIV